MRAANPEKQKSLDNGMKVEVVQEGSGAPCEALKGVTLRYAIWDTEGKNLACTEVLDDRISGMLDKLGSQRIGPMEFLMPLVQNAKVGEIVRAEVPDSVWGRVRAATVWEVEVLRVNDVPKFRGLAADKTVTTQTGLKYEVIDAGDGVAPKRTDTVAALYTGWLTDGTLFDSAHARGEPTEFPLNRVIAGWTEGLQLMKPGAKFLFEIPGELGYGAKGSPPTIPANATLIFYVELVAVKAPQSPQRR
ncbi:MAG: FKBP-type peptidyl-prolyl cis-trans isomerase [Planctomycetes bacterium]|nr:FKBP-type peptidyl-prolyl cis-trans isomerase [Planctomycetota bacterium]